MCERVDLEAEARPDHLPAVVEGVAQTSFVRCGHEVEAHLVGERDAVGQVELNADGKAEEQAVVAEKSARSAHTW